MALRDYELLTEEGESLAVSTSSWLIMNMESRRLKRTSEILGEKGMHYMDRDAIAKSCGKLIAPDNLQLVYTKRVRISDIDYNHHANNARYADWIIDAFGMDFLKEHPLDEIQINYNSECTFDNLVEIYKVPVAENSFYVEGRSDGHNIFQSLISFK
jgi:acyl-ACP thioesterase